MKSNVDILRKKYSRPLIKSATGELLPDFRLSNNIGFDVTADFNIDYLTGDSDIPMLLNTVNKYCPTAYVSHIFNSGKRIGVDLGNIVLHIELRDNKIIKTRIARASRFMGIGAKRINIIYDGNDIEKVFNDEFVKSNIDSILLNKNNLY